MIGPSSRRDLMSGRRKWSEIRGAVSDEVLEAARARARTRDLLARQELIERAGGLLSLDETAERLGESTQEIDRQRGAGLLLGVQVPEDE